MDLTLIHIVSRFRNSAARYVLSAWLLIPNTIVALAIFLPFRIPERQPYSSTFGFTRSIFELHRVIKSPESLVTKHVLQGVCVCVVWLALRTLQQMAAMWSILVAAILFFVRSGCFPTNQSIHHFIYVSSQR